MLLVRGTVAGGNVGAYGVYTRNAQDTVWKRITKSNVITFGLGYFEKGATRRYYIAAGNGLHRSVDGGKSWRVLTKWTTEEILCVVPDPIDSALMYVATPFGMFKSEDDGSTWLRKMNGFKKWFIQRIIMDSRDRLTLYAASEDDIYKTTDAGEHWFPLNVGASKPLALLQNPVKPSQFIAGFEDVGIRHSSDNGVTWKSAEGLKATSIYTLCPTEDGNEIYAAGWKSGLWRSNDGGMTWQQVWLHDEAFEAIYSICVDPNDARHLFLGSVGAGVYESFDRGKNWQRAGLPGAQVKQIEFYP